MRACRCRVVLCSLVLCSLTLSAAGADAQSAAPSRSVANPAPVASFASWTGDVTRSERAGPRVEVYASPFAQSASRYVSSDILVGEDAYVLVGHIGVDGEMRIVYPATPDDPGRVKAGTFFHLPDLFVGFTADRGSPAAHYRRILTTTRSRYESYDGGLDYLFVLASREPLRRDQVSENGQWLSFETAERRDRVDPRADAAELASLLAGEDGRVTLEFANRLHGRGSSAPRLMAPTHPLRSPLLVGGVWR